MKVLIAQSCLTLGHPMNCSPPGSSVHGILSSGGLPNAGIELRSPTVQADSLSEPPGREGHKGMEEMVMNKGTEWREGTEK